MRTSIAIIAFALFCGSLAYGQAGIGATYGSREPVTCQSKKEPARGAPSPQQAAMYWRCEKEGTRSGSDINLYLYENVKLDVGKGRPFQASDQFSNDVDPSQLIYPVRGTMDMYQCADPKRSTPPSPGHNCSFTAGNPLTGACYKTAFGDWRCDLGYDYDWHKTVRNVPGPR